MLKRIDMVAYSIELAYDSENSPVDNILESPGFGSFLIARKIKVNKPLMVYLSS